MVGWPFVKRPQGVVGCWPLLDLPPWGWSTGFFAIPRTTGLKPQLRTIPALGILKSKLLILETTPKEAKQSPFNHILQPEGNFIKTLALVFFKMIAWDPADRQTLPPENGANSIL